METGSLVGMILGTNRESVKGTPNKGLHWQGYGDAYANGMLGGEGAPIHWIHGVLAQQQESRHVRGDVRGGGRHCPVGLGRLTLRHTSSNGAYI